MSVELTPTPWFLIGDEFGPLEGLPTIPVTDPATGARIGDVPLADAALVDRAVTAARAGQRAWAAIPATKRARTLLALVRLLERDTETLAAIISRDNGKAVSDARSEIARAIEHLEAAATAPALLAGERTIDVLPGLDAAVVREPIGVCAVVAPFNFPIMTGLIYWAWALACGNAVILKPSEQAPYAAAALAGLVREAGFPAGTMTVLHGAREAVEALCDHPGIASLSLVGSSATALAVYQRAAASGKRVHAAGGARNPVVVLADADLDVAADAVATSVFAMGGQRCLSSSILLVEAGIHDELVSRIAARADALRVLPGDDPASDVPPLISRAAVDAVARILDDAEGNGLAVARDGRTGDLPDGDGYFIGPSIVTGVPASSELLTRETFGPLLAVVRVDGLDEALEIVNASPFGNAGSIFTRDGGAARRFARDADVGNIGVNVGVAAPTAQVAFGGRRRSFVGTIHSQGRHAVEFYTDIKSISERW